MINRTLTLTQNGKAREVTVEEALQHKTYQAAIAGSRAAQREVLKMIAKREKWLQAARTRNRRSEIERLTEPVDPRNADEAMLLLGIAERDPRWVGETTYGERLLLQTWAVQAALSRPGRRHLRARDVSEINRCTQNAGQLKWPASVSREEDR